jgi:hypothetical protein
MRNTRHYTRTLKVAALRMEQLFTPTRRLQDQHDLRFDEPHVYNEVQLTVSTEAILNRSWDWSEYHAFATSDEGELGKILWITEETFIYIEGDDYDSEQGEFLYWLGYYHVQHATLTLPSGETQYLFLANLVDSASLLTGASSLFWHAVTRSKCVRLRLERMNCCELPSGPAIVHFQTAVLGLELLEFNYYTFKGDDYRTLASLERAGLEITFEECTFDAHGVKDAFIQWLRHSQVVTKLESCKMADSIICALSGNRSVKSFSFNFGIFRVEQSERQLQFLAQALQGNQGIELLRVLPQSDETRSLLLRSLWAHPRILSLTIPYIDVSPSAASKTIMMTAVLQMVRCNTVVRAINLRPGDDAKYEEFFRNSIVPRLEMNRMCFQDQRQALTRADPAIRGQLLGRALHAVHYNPDLQFRFLSENVPAFVRSDEDGPTIPTTFASAQGRKRKARP